MKTDLHYKKFFDKLKKKIEKHIIVHELIYPSVSIQEIIYATKKGALSRDFIILRGNTTYKFKLFSLAHELGHWKYYPSDVANEESISILKKMGLKNFKKEYLAFHKKYYKLPLIGLKK